MSRKQEDLRVKSSFVPSRERRNDLDHELYLTSRRGAREQPPLRSRRSLSPQYMLEGTRRTVARDRRSSSLERRIEYDQHIDRVHGGHVQSRSPPVEHAQTRLHMDGRAFSMSPTSMEVQRKFDYPEYLDHGNNLNSRSKHPSSYDHIDICKQKDYSARRSSASGYCTMVDSVPIEDAMDRDGRLIPNYGFASRYGEPSGNHKALDMHRSKHYNSRYQDAVPHEKLVKGVHYKDVEKSVYYSRGSPYLESPLSQIKDFGNEDLLKGAPSTSSGIVVRGDYLSKLRDIHTLPSVGYHKRYGTGFEPLVNDDYGQRTLSDTSRGYEAQCRDAKCYACYAYTSTRPEHKGYLYPDIEVRGDNEPGYTSQGNLYFKMQYVRGEHNHRDLIRQDTMDTTVESIAKAEGSHSSRRIIKNNGVRELDVIQKDMASDYIDMRGSSNALIQAGDYLDSGYPHVEIMRKVSDHHHALDFEGLHEHGPEDPLLGYGYGRYASAGSDRTRLKSSSEYKNYVESQRIARGFERTEVDQSAENDRMLKRKYSTDEDMSKIGSRSVIHNKWNMPTETDEFHDHRVEWTRRKASGVNSRKSSGYERSHCYAEVEQISDETCCHKDSTKVGLTTYQDQSESIQEHSGKPFETGGRHFRGYTKPKSSKSYSYVNHSHQRSNQYKQHNLRPKNEDDNHVAVPAEAADLSEDSGAPWKCELSEDSDGFKQRIQVAFLDFSKRFNENPTARKLYKEEGKAGSLFCVVCRRSASKEFLNTKALATHAFMSPKAGLRPQHLGLHKAICFLMGWNTMPDPDSGTWTPEALPRAEALAQKEDLILWPPVVIVHNISLSNNDHNEWKLINIDALGEFLRAKGFHLGKMKICLGNPGDHSIILVKFLGTFSGLQEAERLHKYFLDRKRGRVDFQQAISSIGRGADAFMRQGGSQLDKLEDVLLYGYMGISEDLDKVDFDTKKRCSVKSKEEIHELADSPVKPQ